MLEELRLLSNINAGKDQLLQLILVGQPQLKGHLNKPELLQLAQRVGSDFHLTPLNKEEVHAYIDTRLAIAGCKRRVFSDRAIDLIAEQSRGVPRVINIVADTALVYAFSAEELVVGVETIRNVIRDKTEFGVFGIASDEDAAPPLKSQGDGGIDSFADGASKSEAVIRDEFDRDEFDRTGDEPEDLAPSRDPAPVVKSTPEPAPAPKPARVMPVADIKTQVESKPAVVPAAQYEPGPSRQDVREESAITGVVVVSAHRKISPEAAIRSAGDGRAIVFVAIGAAPEAVAIAKKAGAIVVEDDGHTLNTGGRARNAGYRQLKKIAPHVKYVQFVDAEYAIAPDWIGVGEKFMARRPEVSVVEGFLKTHDGSDIQLATLRDEKRIQGDGEIQCANCGTALVRTENFEAIGGFRGDLTTAETEDLCIRLRRRGARIWRSDAVMAICRPSLKVRRNWWRDHVKRGFKNAYSMSLHGGPPERLGVYDTMMAIVWGFLFPVGILGAAIAGGLAAGVLDMRVSPIVLAAGILAVGVFVFAVLVGVSVIRRGIFRPSSWARAFGAVFGRIPEFAGASKVWLSRKA